MEGKENYKSLLPPELFREIEGIYDSFLEIQKEAVGVAQENKMPDTAAHLQDVLKSTEEATDTILDAATAIQGLADKVNGDEAKAELGALVSRIYEACNFQDLTGQRIKKVLKNLGTLEERIKSLAASAKVCAQPVADKDAEVSLLNGPQLSHEAPSQNDIDALFSSLK